MTDAKMWKQQERLEKLRRSGQKERWGPTGLNRRGEELSWAAPGLGVQTSEHAHSTAQCQATRRAPRGAWEARSRLGPCLATG